jgi:xylitol oxidase
LWLSPYYEQPCVTHSFYLEAGLARREQIVARDRERTRWVSGAAALGQAVYNPEVLKTTYRKMPKSIELSRKYDPDGKFRNEFLNKEYLRRLRAWTQLCFLI